MNRYAALAALALAASAGFGAAWQWQASTITQMELDYEQQQHTQARTALRRLEADTTKIVTATNEKISRDANLRRDTDRAVNAGNGLRITSTEATRAAQADAATCFASIAIYDQLLSTVVEAGGHMASEADAWESDAIMLQAILAK